MKIGVLIDGGRVAKWQADALRAIGDGNRFLIYNCTNSHASRRPVKHMLYYGLNLVSVRNALTRAMQIPTEIDVAGQTDFSAEVDGRWERLPEGLLDRIADDAPDVIVKFGMGLLRVPPRDRLACPILSYHHGDPRRFRGRPAGFYELSSGTRQIGQIVQILSDSLDAGEVVAFAETKAHPHSWRLSLMEAFRVSPLLLGPAIDNALAGTPLPMEREGTNYRLPSNRAVLGFAARMAAAKVRRLAYGAIVEKRWRVGEAVLPDDWTLDDLQAVIEQDGSSTLAMRRPYRFLADPFFSPHGGILAEAMRPNGAGEIVRIEDDEWHPLPVGEGHCSYPATAELDDRHFLLPESSSWSSPRLFELTASGVEDQGEVDIMGRPRLLDATLFERGGRWYLFANRRDEGDRVLRLWVSDSLLGRFSEHPQSPIRISPAGSRMAGLLLEHRGALYRPGQDLRRGYGDGLIVYRVEQLSPDDYRESPCLELRFANRRGPHTLNVRGKRVLFDHYEERLSPLAGIRRLRQSRSG